MTLMELLVSLAILSIMILMANSLLVSARRTIGLAQDAIKANANVRAVAGRLRADIAGATKEGFLAIAYDVNDIPHLVFTAAGTYRSVLDASVANAAVIDFGLTNDTNNDTNRVLWRRAWLQDPNIPQVTNDRYPGPLAVWRNIAETRTLIRARLGLFTLQPALTLPVNGLAAAQGLWPYLIGDVQTLKIQWTDGVPDADGRLTWYDSKNPYRLDTNGNPVWPRVDASLQDLAPVEDLPEFNLTGADQKPYLYCALWTFKKKSSWPKAIRFELSVGDPPRLFEVVVSLPN